MEKGRGDVDRARAQARGGRELLALRRRAGSSWRYGEVPTVRVEAGATLLICSDRDRCLGLNIPPNIVAL